MTLNSRFICIHGHFYQPPRENPWLEEIEVQESAFPYHDWNERVHAECYAPNASPRALNGEGKVIDTADNYSRMSFNFGPTLLSWMERHAPETYAAVLEADRQSRKNFGGHGSAIAQAYNHIIMPLADLRDKRTQIVWGIRDFERRFRRQPEGMWLAETAVDLETLDLLAESGIRFTILAPVQARRVRRIGETKWTDVSEGRIDPKQSYACILPSGRKIGLFFYNGPIAHDIAFGDLLNDGESFARRLLGAFEDSPVTQLSHVATDGETFGHHHRFGDMALAFALHSLQTRGLARLTVYGEHLAASLPSYEVEIVENSSWSCVHGVERWRNDCDCSTGRHPGWHQRWRAPLREALDRLRDRVVILYQSRAGALLRDPWAARDDYISVILDRSRAAIDGFLARHAAKGLDMDEKALALKLLEMQRNALLMFTSCGWFFDDISGIETRQILLYAARAMQLAGEAGEASLEDDFLRLLRRAPSNIPELGDGARVYEIFVRPTVLAMLRATSGIPFEAAFCVDDLRNATQKK